MIFGRPQEIGAEQPVQTQQDGMYMPGSMPGRGFNNMQLQAEDARRQAFLDSIKAINLPQQSGMNGIQSRYTQQQGGGQMNGLQPMQMYQNRNQFQHQLGGLMQPMQMLNQYRQTGSVSEPQAGMSDTQRSQLGTALGSNSVTGGK